MENHVEEKQNKLGAGIIILTILNIIGCVSNMFSFTKAKATVEAFEQLNIHVSVTYFYITSALSVVLLISCILLLMKKSVGVYIFFVTSIINLLSTFIFMGVNLVTLMAQLLNIIFTLLLAFFIYKKKHLYFK